MSRAGAASIVPLAAHQVRRIEEPMSPNDLDDWGGMVVPEDLPPEHRSGFVAVVGRPNVGKSTLMNAYLGQKIAIVSPKPQTTRDRLLGILTLVRERGDLADAQIIFVDTPGIHQPLHKLGEYMVETAIRAIPDADVVLFLVDASRPPSDEDRQIAEILQQRGPMPVLLTLNKADLLTPEQETTSAEAYRALGHFDDWLPVSALHGDNLNALLEATIERLPFGPRYYPEDQVTDQQTRFIAAELVREQVLRHIRQEIPYSVAVIVDQFKARSEDMTYISANIFVERDTQKAIILGQGGRMIKRIGKDARQQIEELVGTRVYLELWVKVRKKWRQNENELERMGYSLHKGD
jgi:GTP-binding protein Era